MQKGITKGEELKSKHAKMTSIWKIFPENKFPEHPSPFPLAIPTRCIYSIADEQSGLTILDPYCGIGSTLVAAKALKHNYVGIDCSQEYVDVANQRLEKMDEIERVMDEVGKHCVEKSYEERKKSSKK
jgi:modification methylase